MSSHDEESDLSSGISSESFARLLLALFLGSLILGSAFVSVEFTVAAIVIALLVVIAFQLWNLSRSVAELNRTLQSSEERGE
ncbi:hypothetical protein BV210_09765 [Halorientalis sp. IM1011]|uniref:hypothetical protein n=1 Tax=Halorientalis sp. IM1011 TaxID=1932360 RepID=UPI00097CC18B|nr:hypothetical protein [Halorientalis sp. IM1011]AQL42983.1 hypothetical protein BV210_09765 [Halorientalis sp. IM1011]